jgi:hypothetical protein
MLWNASVIVGFHVVGSNGAFGTVQDLLLDDRDWTLRWMVVDTGSWLPGRKVLVPTRVLKKPDPALNNIFIAMTKEEISLCPDVDTDLPVSSDTEQRLYEFFALDLLSSPSDARQTRNASTVDQSGGVSEGDYIPSSPDPHLRSLNALLGYQLTASDGDIGHISDFLINDDDWNIRLMVVDTGTWWPGTRVLIPVKTIKSVDWQTSVMLLSVDQAKVRASPVFQPETTVDGAYAETMLTYYGINWLHP